MKVLHISFSDLEGGAARAAFRIHMSLNELDQKGEDIQSYMCVINKVSDDPNTFTRPRRLWRKLCYALFVRVARLPRLALRTANTNLHSHAILSSGFLSFAEDVIKKYSIDLIHLHWLGDWTLSIREIGLLKLPVIWTLHDEWVFSGAEHYQISQLENPSQPRYIDGYHNWNRPAYERGIDLNKMVWSLKKKYWRTPFNVVAPSCLMQKEASKSSLLKNSRVVMIPHPIDTSRWFPESKQDARKLLGIPLDVPVIVYGAIGAFNDKRKGGDIAKKALSIVRNIMPDIFAVTFGGETQESFNECRSFDFGYIRDDSILRRLYSAADVVMIPSRQEAFGQVALEAILCGAAVVAFKGTGMDDIVEMSSISRLSEFNLQSFSANLLEAIQTTREDKYLDRIQQTQEMRKMFSTETVGRQYLSLYSSLTR